MTKLRPPQGSQHTASKQTAREPFISNVKTLAGYLFEDVSLRITQRTLLRRLAAYRRRIEFLESLKTGKCADWEKERLQKRAEADQKLAAKSAELRKKVDAAEKAFAAADSGAKKGALAALVSAHEEYALAECALDLVAGILTLQGNLQQILPADADGIRPLIDRLEHIRSALYILEDKKQLAERIDRGEALLEKANTLFLAAEAKVLSKLNAAAVLGEQALRELAS